MPELMCARPHEKSVDFTAGRFVVCTGRGIDIGTVDGVRHLEMGDEVPDGALTEQALRQLYERPVHAIETVEHAATLPHLREACARWGSVAVEEEKEEVQDRGAKLRDLDQLSRAQLAALCRRGGLSNVGSRESLRDRLASLLE